MTHQDLPPTIDHPAAWRGDELFSRADWSSVLQPEEIAELDQVLASENRSEPWETRLADATPLGRLGERLSRLRTDLEQGSGACMIRGLPLERYSEEQVRRLFWTIACRIGTPVTQSPAGERIFSVRDEGYQIGHPKARGPNTRKRLSFHTDRCDVIGFLCLQQARTGGENQLVSSMTLYNELRTRFPDQLRVLMQPFYYARHNVDTANDKPWCRQPIFSFCKGFFACSYLRVLIDRAYAMEGLPNMTEEQVRALDCLEELASDPSLHVTFRQQPGDLLFLNNWVTLHRRNEFEDHPDPPRRRHILRIWLSVPNSRPIDPLFADSYGATEAGAIRGGMRAALPDDRPRAS